MYVRCLPECWRQLDLSRWQLVKFNSNAEKDKGRVNQIINIHHATFLDFQARDSATRAMAGSTAERNTTGQP